MHKDKYVYRDYNYYHSNLFSHFQNYDWNLLIKFIVNIAVVDVIVINLVVLDTRVSVAVNFITIFKSVCNAGFPAIRR